MGKLQEVLSGLKSFAQSDTGKTLAKAVGTVAAGKYGGAQGISAFSSALERSRLEEERRKKEEEDRLIREENRDLRKLQRTKAELDIKKAESELMPKAEKLSQQDWTLKNTRAVEPDEISAGVKKAVGRVKGDKEPKMPAMPAPTPISIDDPEAIARGEVDAAKWAAKTIQAMGLMGAGKQAWDNNKIQLDADLRDSGMTKEQQAAAWKEMSRLIMPGRYEQIPEEMAAAASPDYNWSERAAEIPSFVSRNTGLPVGAAAGVMLGAPAGPVGMLAGGVAGGMIGDYATRALTTVFEGQKDAASTPAVAGSGKSAAEDMSGYSEDNEYAMRIARGLGRVGITATDTPAIVAQLADIPELANDQQRRDRIIELVRQNLSMPQSASAQWLNSRAWR